MIPQKGHFLSYSQAKKYQYQSKERKKKEKKDMLSLVHTIPR